MGRKTHTFICLIQSTNGTFCKKAPLVDYKPFGPINFYDLNTSRPDKEDAWV